MRTTPISMLNYNVSMVALRSDFSSRTSSEHETRTEHDRKLLKTREKEIAEDVERALRARLGKANINGKNIEEISGVVVSQLRSSPALIATYLGEAKSPQAKEAAMSALIEKVESVFSNASVAVTQEKVAETVRRSRENSLMRGAVGVEEVRQALETYITASYVPNALGLSPHELRASELTHNARVQIIEELRRQEEESRQRPQPRGAPTTSSERSKHGRSPADHGLWRN